MQNSAASRPVQLLPIDIHYDKLLDWLIDRRHCTVKWPVAQQAVRERVTKAVEDMPDGDEIAQLMRSTSLNYFHCRRIVELLKVSEADTRNMFGWYSSQRMKDWQDIVSEYENNKVYLAECAQMLIRTVSFEVPALKQQIKRAQQQVRDCERKQAEYNSTASQHQQRFAQECKKMNIEGKNIKLELLHQVKDLPQIYRAFSKGVENLASACEYYQAVVDFLLTQNSKGLAPSTETCPLLRYLQRHGNTTLYQWRTGQVPEVVEEDDWLSRRLAELTPQAPVSTSATAATADDVAVDFGDSGMDLSAAAAAADTGAVDFGEGFSMDAIDFDDAPSDQGATDLADIDFGDLVIDETPSSSGAGEGTTADIDFDIVVEDSGTSNEQGVHTAKGEDALSVLECPRTRDVFVNELQELEAFLLQRLSELSGNTTDILSVTMLQSAPLFLQVQSEESVRSMLTSVQHILSLWHEDRTQHLIKICASPRALDRLAESLDRKRQLSDKMISKASHMRERQLELAQTQRDTEPRLTKAIAHAKELQEQMQEEISKLYKNRKVNIMGDVNNL